MGTNYVLTDEFDRVLCVRPGDYNWDTYILREQQGDSLPREAVSGSQQEMAELQGRVASDISQSYGQVYMPAGGKRTDYMNLQVVPCVRKPDGQMG